MIPVFDPLIGPEEIDLVVDALKKGEISGSFGSYITRFEEEFARYCGCQFGVAVNSGTSALQLAVIAGDIKPNDEVLVSASTNIATALAIYHAGAIPVPVDSEDRTGNLDLNLIESLITPKTKAILPVHLYGHPVDMDRLMQIAKKYHLLVIEDGAEAHGALCRNRKIGSFGHMSCFSFYVNKVITTGEGGMVVTNEKAFADKVRSLRNLAFTEPRFVHYEAGFNYRLTNIQAAIGLAQLRKIDRIVDQKRMVASLYTKYLSSIQQLILPLEESWALSVYWMYCIVLKPSSLIKKERLMKLLEEKGIQTRSWFCPMNLQPIFQKIPGFKKLKCPRAEYYWENGLYLPSSCKLTENDIKGISLEIANILK